MPSWTAENKFRLLLAIIGKNGNLKINYEEVAATMGPEFTVVSVKYVWHLDTDCTVISLNVKLRSAFKRIKQEAGISAATEGNGVAVTPKKGTPRAPRTPSKRKGDEVGNGGEDDEELDSKSPKRAKKTAIKVKAKDEEEE